MFKLARFLKNFKLQLIVGPAFKLIEAIFELIVPIVMAKIIDVGVAQGDKTYVLKMGGVLVLLGIVGLCSTLVCQYFASNASQGVGTELRSQLLRHINSLSPKDRSAFGTHALLTYMTNDINNLQFATAMLIRLVVRAPFLTVGAIIMALTIDVPLTLVLLVTSPLIVLSLYFIMSRTVPHYKKTQGQLDRVSLLTRENLLSQRVVRAFSAQEREEERFSAATGELADSAVRVNKLSALLNPLTQFIMNAGIIAIIWFGGGRIYVGELTQGELVAFVNYMSQILIALTVVANLVIVFTKASASAARINAVFDTAPEVVSGTAHVNTDCETAVEFKNVSFGYSSDDSEGMALSGIDFKIKKGETVGIIGGTGCGKTTLAELITRLMDVGSGSVCVFGSDVRSYDIGELRRTVGIVSQKASVLNTTVRENMKIGREDATDKEIIDALEAAQAADFVRALPHGLDTELSEGGVNLSGGQRQRLSIARLLVRMPEILIFDDSFSSLDARTDAGIRRNLTSVCRGKTVIFISQRVRTIYRADRIAVMDNGKIIGSGTHDELLRTCPTYREICSSQLHGEGEDK